jgi:hypothetical protein
MSVLTRNAPPFPTVGFMAAACARLAALSVLLGSPTIVAAQDVTESAPEWNDDRSMEIVRAAMRTRHHTFSDSSLRNFEVESEGHVYLLTDIEGQERLVRADQIALRIVWEAPNNISQTIVGRRFDQSLPSRIRYHVDHLAITVDNFGNSIRLGEGDEVAGVRHPVWRGAERHYDYRLVDSTEVRFSGGRARVYEVDVRPVRFDRPGLIGTLFIDRDTWAIARMSFTFTPISYRDPRLTGLDVDIENALWDGRYWLPVRQVVEVRRSSLWLSFPISATIRTEHRIGPYRINVERAGRIPPGEKIASASPERLKAFDDWSSDLLDGPVERADTAAIDMERIRTRAKEIVGRRVVPSGRFRVWLQGISSFIRSRRAEGFLLGAGGEYSLPTGSARAWIGYPFGHQLPELTVELDFDLGQNQLRLEGYRQRLTDIGPIQAASGITSTASLGINGEDFTDPYFRDGARATFFFPWADARSSISAGWERQESALLSTGVDDARPIRPIRDGDVWSTTASLRPRLPGVLGAGVTGRLDAEGGILDGDGYVRWLFGVELDGRRLGSPWGWEAEIGGALAAGTLPPQRLVLLGGRRTVPGYPFRGWGGDQAFFAKLLGSRRVIGRWLNLRAFATVGTVGVTPVSAGAAEFFGTSPSGGLRPSLGAGIGVVNDFLRVDVARGLDDGVWEWMVSFNRDLWPMM